ncbi:MAG: recombinase family protein [Rubricoccaceae bacterium]
MRAWCSREGIEVAGHYQDDHSAKTFERPAWAQLLARVESGRVPDADAVLVVKWDRFSRDATGALGMIRRLEARSVSVQAVEQPIDSSVPEQLMMLAIYVAAPEVENRRRSLATKQGMRRAMREGRYVNVPPKGYARGADAEGRYLIVPGEDADFVREAFRLADETDLPVNVIARRLRKAGFRCSKNQLHLLLKNPLYAGRLVIPAWRGEPEEAVEGLHEPLVSRATFARIQEKRFRTKGSTAGRRRKIVPEIPLKGHLLDPDSAQPLYGSASRSCTGVKVWYYHGAGRGAYRVRADEVHEAFEDMLAEVRLAPKVAELLRAMAAERGAAAESARRRRRSEAVARLEKAETRLLEVDTRFLDGDLDRESHARLLAHYRNERDAAQGALADVEAAVAVEPLHV